LYFRLGFIDRLRTLETVKQTITVLTLGDAFEQFCCRQDEREPLLVRKLLLNLQDPETI
jgi:hypothetical protein